NRLAMSPGMREPNSVTVHVMSVMPMSARTAVATSGAMPCAWLFSTQPYGHSLAVAMVMPLCCKDSTVACARTGPAISPTNALGRSSLRSLFFTGSYLPCLGRSAARIATLLVHATGPGGDGPATRGSVLGTDLRLLA